MMQTLCRTYCEKSRNAECEKWSGKFIGSLKKARQEKEVKKRENNQSPREIRLICVHENIMNIDR